MSDSVDPEAKARLVRTAAVASVATAAVLVILKLAAWWITGAVSLLATMVDSLMDVAASGLTLFTVAKATQPADADHRFGHSKAEALGVMGQAIFVGGSGLFVLYEALNRLVHPSAIAEPDAGIVVTAIAICLSLGLIAFQTVVIRRTGSAAIRADSLHFRSDIAVGAGTLLTLWLIQRLGWPLLDPIYAVVVGAYILLTAYRLLRDALDVLMDRELPDDTRAAIAEAVRAVPAVRGIDDLRTRSAGMRQFIQLNIELDPGLTVAEADRITDQVERILAQQFPAAEVIVHPEPEGAPARRRAARRHE